MNVQLQGSSLFMGNSSIFQNSGLKSTQEKLQRQTQRDNQIAAAKEEYNQSQMYNAMDEAKERGEQIAKAAEKYTPKTPEERREELVEEALGTDENKGELTESME